LALAPLSTDTRTILLLCGQLVPRRPGIRPLTQAEYHDLERLLEARRLAPGSLVEDGPRLLSTAGLDGALAVDHLAALLARGQDLDRALEAWHRAGIWVLGERDPDYPRRLRRRMAAARAPLIFGAGPRGNLDGGGVCIVGSRDSSAPALEFARTLGARCGREGLTVISSDMRGVDREAIAAALEGGGRVISVLSESLEKTVAAPRYRDALARGRITLVTPFSPDTRFTVANAMRANRYRYALSDAAVIVETRRKGGIWSGAEENRKEGWVPAFVRSGDAMPPGNQALLHLGLLPITQGDIAGAPKIGDFLFARALGTAAPGVADAGAHPDLYTHFLAGFQALAADSPQGEAAIMEHFGIERSQARAWLRRAVAEGKATRSGRPLRYSAVP
jgi:predicted Rossmann fold nucleotide-binding protein DprA/Smf involved in DNA uptake